MKIKEIIVVEGRDDTARIKLAVDADTIETNGSAIDDHVIDQIRLAQKTRGVIILTDPDFPGEKIRKTISEAVPGCKHAFLPKHLAKPKNKRGIGVEHASVESIRACLENVHEQLPACRMADRKRHTKQYEHERSGSQPCDCFIKREEL